jgi:hypothetical protein
VLLIVEALGFVVAKVHRFALPLFVYMGFGEAARF